MNYVLRHVPTPRSRIFFRHNVFDPFTLYFPPPPSLWSSPYCCSFLYVFVFLVCSAYNFWGQKSKMSLQGWVPPRSSRRESVSLRSVASKDCLCSLAYGSLFHFQSQQRGILKLDLTLLSLSHTPTSLYKDPCDCHGPMQIVHTSRIMKILS